LPAYNAYIARLHSVLQKGGHVADIGVLYPIASLQAAYRFDVGDPRVGGETPPEADYMDLGEMLSLKIHRDFTFVHPQILDDKCSVQPQFIQLNNQRHHEQYRVMIMPGSRTIRWSNLQTIQKFYRQGGIVIATTRLPDTAAEFGQNSNVLKTVAEMFTASEPTATGLFTCQTNAQGGKTYFIPKLTATTLKTVLDDALVAYDVTMETDPSVQGGNVSYIHKSIGAQEVYFFGNSSDTSVETSVRLRGRWSLEEWDPHTGQNRPLNANVTISTVGVTRFKLQLGPIQSRFIVATPQ
jgi:hypothetical protein